MAENYGFTHPDQANATVKVIMHIRTAHAARTNADQYVILCRTRDGFSFNTEIILAVKSANTGLH